LADKGSISPWCGIRFLCISCCGSEEEIKNNKKLPICSAGYVWVDVLILMMHSCGYIVPDFEGYGSY
jgi:hypothetical protein